MRCHSPFFVIIIQKTKTISDMIERPCSSFNCFNKKSVDESNKMPYLVITFTKVHFESKDMYERTHMLYYLAQAKCLSKRHEPISAGDDDLWREGAWVSKVRHLRLHLLNIVSVLKK